MHNRKKSEAARTEEQEKLVERKKVAYNGLSSQVLERRANGEQSVEVMALTEQLIRVNPDFYSVWNYRREILLGLHAEIGLTEAVPEEKLQSDAAIAVRNFELNLSSAGIKKNPKSYGAWHHRQWILTRIIPDLEAELDLCQQFLKADQRNFHCWNYRRYLVSIGGVRSDSEIEFSTLKIEENFSNYSAFHHRSVYIRQFEVAVPELIEQEMSIVESAIFTDPFDQSAFWYYQFLLRWGAESVEKDSAVLDWYKEFLQTQVVLLESLLEVEERSKWALVALVETIQRQLAARSAEEDTTAETAKIQEYLQLLCEIDVKHINRYIYLGAKM